MGGTGNLLLPVGSRRMSSWSDHQRRSPKSEEPGTDFYCPIGTPVLAPDDGVIFGYGNTIAPPTGRWVGIKLSSGMAFRAMHFSRLVRTSGTVKRGEIIGYSGASGYGYEDWSWNPNTGGAHVHVTLWPTATIQFGYKSNGQPYTVDFMNYVGGTASGGGQGEEDMPLNADTDYAALREMLWRFFKYDSRDGGAQASGALGPTVFERLTAAAGKPNLDQIASGVTSNVLAGRIQAQTEDGIGVKDAQGNPVTYPLSGFVASTNAQVNSLRTKGIVTEAQVKAIADAVIAATGGSNAAINYAAIAKAVNDDASQRLAG